KCRRDERSAESAHGSHGHYDGSLVVIFAQLRTQTQARNSVYRTRETEEHGTGNQAGAKRGRARGSRRTEEQPETCPHREGPPEHERAAPAKRVTAAVGTESDERIGH